VWGEVRAAPVSRDDFVLKVYLRVPGRVAHICQWFCSPAVYRKFMRGGREEIGGGSWGGGALRGRKGKRTGEGSLPENGQNVRPKCQYTLYQSST